MLTTTPKLPLASSNTCNEQECEVIINEDGGIAFVYQDDLYSLLAPLFPGLKIVRASHVEPTAQGTWEVDVAPLLRHLDVQQVALPAKQVIATTTRHATALVQEVEWVKNHLRGATC